MYFIKRVEKNAKQNINLPIVGIEPQTLRVAVHYLTNWAIEAWWKQIKNGETNTVLKTKIKFCQVLSSHKARIWAKLYDKYCSFWVTEFTTYGQSR